VNTGRFKTDHPLQFGLSMLAGSGLIIMILALGIGVLTPGMDSGSIGFFLILGLVLLISGIVGWFSVVRPHTHFDDINEPLAEAHSHGHATEGHDTMGDDSENGHALPASTQKAIEPAQH
jgi:hypothetical protein